MHERIKFAVIGCGNIGKRHAEMINGNPETELVAVADINADISKFVKENYGVPFYLSGEDLLNSSIAIDVVCVCTPNSLHTPIALKAIERDMHVVCEKPMGLTSEACAELVHRAEKFNKDVFCVMQNRYSPPAVWLKDVIERKLLGEIFLVQVNCYWNRDDRYYKDSPWKGTLEMDGGPLFTQFSHFVDLMYWLFGDIKDIIARFENFNHKTNTEFEDSGIVNFNFLSQGIGNFNYSTSAFGKNLESSITIIGEHGSIKVGGQYMEKVEFCHVKDYEMPVLREVSPPNDYGPYKGSAANHHFVIQNVVDTLRGNSKVTTNAKDGMKVVEIIERIYSQRVGEESRKS